MPREERLLREERLPDEKAMSEPFILFELGGTIYGIRSRVIQQMEMIERVTPVPNAPPFVDGVVASRGQVIPAVNLRARFGLARAPYDLRTRLVVVNIGGRVVGLVVDTAREFVSVPAGAIQPPPEAISELSGKYLEGIATLGERLVLIIRPEAVLDLADAVATLQAGQMNKSEIGV